MKQLIEEEAETDEEDVEEDLEESLKVKLCHVNCKNKFRGMSMCNPSSKHLGMSNCMKNLDEFKKLPSHWDTISKMTSIHKFPNDVVNDFLRLATEALQVNKVKSSMLSSADKLNHRVRFEFYSHSTLEDETKTIEDTSIPALNLNELLVSVQREAFVAFQLKEITLVTDPLESFLQTCCEKSFEELRTFFCQLHPSQLSTLSFCLERTVEMMNLIGFSGRMSSHMRKFVFENGGERCIPWTNIPVAFFNEVTNVSESKFSLFSKR